jgi:hypothetical protein
MRLATLILLAALAAPAAVRAESEVSFAGAWVRDARASRIKGAPPVAEKTVQIVQQGRKGFGYSVQIRWPDGTRRAFTVVGALDGKFRPRAGDAGSMAFMRVGAWGFQGRWKVDARRKGSETCAVSVDGRSLVCRGAETDAAGRKSSWLDVYRRRA